MEELAVWFPVIATVICSSGIMAYIHSIDRKVERLSKKLDRIPEIYVMKADCMRHHKGGVHDTL